MLHSLSTRGHPAASPFATCVWNTTNAINRSKQSQAEWEQVCCDYKTRFFLNCSVAKIPSHNKCQRTLIVFHVSERKKYWSIYQIFYDQMSVTVLKILYWLGSVLNSMQEWLHIRVKHNLAFLNGQNVITEMHYCVTVRLTSI